jgi:hypothetical protein
MTHSIVTPSELEISLEISIETSNLARPKSSAGGDLKAFSDRNI